ncbi:hypothetical protein AAA426_08440 [Lactobacillus crispatus]|uniref:Uncharacterized protein n=1 Tax=Lactobacillus crispatus TaxID=47770 RepID=A0A4R6CSD4_9LACO|nr:hypothetical protein [Lactobacillus crispatus]MBI1717553.1 hypothetical protein [Lactobacillus crispatus]MCT3535988.1 hypothetical protein [Lactobacillus crispatus]MDQ4433097.1 hypothetical protein [Lactobacillus crispatus]TDM85339.1 hypothetical protein CEE95_09990 [Lactobacillus crispatus]TDM94747.1 hypothetical protein CEE89_10065 [Lactobacillus crispatus]
MTEDAKLKQVMNKINDAISWIKQLNCIVPNSINTELNPDDGSVLLYLQTPNNLIVPSLLLNVQTYDYLLEQDDASNGEGIVISWAGSFMDATAPKERTGLDPEQLRQDMDYLCNVWYKLTKQSEAINDYYQDTADLSAEKIKAELQQILTTSGVFDADVLAETETQLAGMPFAYLWGIYQEVQRSTDDSKTAGQLLYHLTVEVPHDSYLFKPDPDFSLLEDAPANVEQNDSDNSSNLIGDPIERPEAEKLATKFRQASELLVQNNLIPVGAFGVEYDEAQHDLIVYLQSPNDVMIFRNDILGTKIATMIEIESVEQCAAHLAISFILNFTRDLQDTAGQISDDDWDAYCADLDYLYRLIFGFSLSIPDVDNYLASTNERSLNDLRQKLRSYVQASNNEDKNDLIEIINKLGYGYLYSLQAYIDSIGDDQAADAITNFLGHSLIYLPNQDIDAGFTADLNFSVLDENNPHDTWQNGSIVIDNNQGDASGIVAELYPKIQSATENLAQRCDFEPGSINVQYSAKQGLLGILFQTPGRVLSPSFAWNAQNSAQLVEMEPEQLETQLTLDYVFGAFGEAIDDLASEISKNQGKIDQDSVELINVDLAYNFERITKLSRTYADMDLALKEMMGDDYAERKMRDFLTTSMQVDDNDAAYQVDGLLIRATYTQLFALYRLMHDCKLLEPKATTIFDLLKNQVENPIKFDVVDDVDLFDNDHDDE